jgi:hypothetical protein
MMYPQVVDGGDGLQIWRIEMKILNKQLWADNKGRSSSLGVGQWANTLHHIRPTCVQTWWALVNTVVNFWVP